MLTTISSIVVAVLGAAGAGITWWISRKNAANTPAQKANAVAARDAADRASAEAALQSTDDTKFEERISE